MASPDDLIDAIIHYESSGDPFAVSPKGAAGLMQLMPGTAKELGVTNRFDEKQNRDGGTRYINQLISKYGDTKKALIAYNWGPGNVDKYGVDKAPDESKTYAQKIMTKAGYGQGGSVGSSIDDFLDDEPKKVAPDVDAFLGDGPAKPAKVMPRTVAATTGRQITPQAQELEEALTKAEKEGGLMKGFGEAGLSLATGLASTVAGGVAGVGRVAASLLSGDGLDKAAEKAADTIRKVQDAGTYQPRGAAGKVLTGSVNAVGEAPIKLGADAGGAIGQAVGGDKGELIGEALGGAAPAVIPASIALKNVAKAAMNRPAAQGGSRGARLLQDAMKDLTPEDIAQAKSLLAKANEEGVSLTGPEAFATAPKLHELLTNVDKSNSVITRFLHDRPAEAKAAIQKKLDAIGEDVGVQAAANSAQEAADTVITNAQKFRTEVASPDYKAQRVSDAEALKLMDDISTTQKDIAAGTAWKNDAIQQAGRWYQFSHEMGLKANDVAKTVQSWAEDVVPGRLKEGTALTVDQWKQAVLKKHPKATFTKEDGTGKTYGEEGDWTAHTGPDMQADVVGVHSLNNEFSSVWDKRAKRDREYTTRENDPPPNDWEGEGGALNPNAERVENYMTREAEGKSATVDAVNEARRRQDFIDGWQKAVEVKSDELAQKNLPFIQEKLSGFMAGLDNKIRLANPNTMEGQILRQFKDDLAPDGKPLMLPSQLESVYKANRDKLELGLNPSTTERTTAGVLRKNIRELDNLIQEVSPSIKQGRQLYAEISKEFVDPLMKSPIGRVAGKGVDDAKEVVHSRVLTELQSKIATPDRIRMLADNLTKVDAEAFPNVVRSFLELKFDDAAVTRLGQTDRLTGAKFAELIAKSPRERANLATMVEKSAQAQGRSAAEARQAAKGFSNLVEVLHSTGRLPRIGVQGIEESALLDKAVAAAPGVTHASSYGAAKALSTAISDIVNKRAYKQLATVFTDKDAVNKMVTLAHVKQSNKVARQQLVADILEQVPLALGGAALVPKPSDDADLEVK